MEPTQEWQNLADHSILYDFSGVHLKNYFYTFEDTEVDETSQFVEIYRAFGNRRIVKKTSICWLLRKESKKLSSDRLLRVQAPQPNINKSSRTSKYVNKIRSLPRKKMIRKVNSRLYKK